MPGAEFGLLKSYRYDCHVIEQLGTDSALVAAAPGAVGGGMGGKAVGQAVFLGAMVFAVLSPSYKGGLSRRSLSR